MSNKAMKELKNLSKNELEIKIREAEAKLFDLRMQMVTGQLQNPSQRWFVRKSVARMKTLLGKATSSQPNQGKTEGVAAPAPALTKKSTKTKGARSKTKTASAD